MKIQKKEIDIEDISTEEAVSATISLMVYSFVFNSVMFKLCGMNLPWEGF
jgi:hypothetical protein